MAFRTFEQIGAACRKKAKRIQARRAGSCPQCKRPIKVGQTIVNVFIPSTEFSGQNRHSGVWNCEDCADFFQRGVDCGALGSSLFITMADMDGHAARPDVIAWQKEAEERSAGRRAG